MTAPGQFSSVSQSRPRRPEVEIDAATDSEVRVVLSVPAGRSADRGKVLERARRMLTRALERDGQRKAEAAGREEEARNAPAARPGSGAWWQF